VIEEQIYHVIEEQKYHVIEEQIYHVEILFQVDSSHNSYRHVDYW
jgi:hypothetical protein